MLDCDMLPLAVDFRRDWEPPMISEKGLGRALSGWVRRRGKRAALLYDSLPAAEAGEQV